MTYDEAKFREFNRMLDDVKDRDIEIIAVAWPEILGDTYEEIVENLARVADAGKKVAIAGRKP